MSRHGRSCALSRARRIVLDWVHFSQDTATTIVERTLFIPEVAVARREAEPRPSWYALFLKAFALAAVHVPQFRHSLLTFPWYRLYEHAYSSALVTIERELEGEPAVLMELITHVESRSLRELDERLKRAKSAPLHEVPSFRRLLRMYRWPRPVRRLIWWLALRVFSGWRRQYFGSFAATTVASLGAEVKLSPTPLSTLFSMSPVAEDGSVVVRLIFDHRVMDGAVVARGLAEIEAMLKGPILEELHAKPQSEILN